MVDFNNEVTVGTPAVDVVRILILQRRADLFESWEKYRQQCHQNIDGDLSGVRARLESFFLELQAGLKRRLDSKKYDKLIKNIQSSKEGTILETIYTLNGVLDDIHLTRIDTKKKYDKTRVEKEHKAKGL